MIYKKLKTAREFIVDNILLEITKSGSLYTSNINIEHVKAKRFSQNVVSVLEKSFKLDKYPSDEEKTNIAQKCNITTKQVNNWFTNKRNRTKMSKSPTIK